MSAVISLLDADPDFADQLDPATVPAARAAARTRLLRLSPGPWDAKAAMEPEVHHRGFLIVDGLLTRTVEVLGRHCVELLGPGDVTLWHPAERWGRVTSDGIVAELPLSHQRLAAVVGAHRPAVTTAMGELARDGAISRRDGGRWVVNGDPPEQLRHHRLAAALT